MSISTQLQRINDAKAQLKTKAIELGIVSAEEDIKIDEVANRYNDIAKIEASHHVLTLRDPSFSIPTGYHNGTGIVEIATTDLTVTPNESQQVAKSEEGYFLSHVTVEAIPKDYIGSNIKRVDNIQDNYNIIEGGSQKFNAGYYDKSFTVHATSDTAGDENAFVTRTEGTAEAADLALGKTAWVNGTKITGNVADIGSPDDDSRAKLTVSVTGAETTNTITDSFTAGLYRDGAEVTVDLSQLEAVLEAI